MTFGAGTKLSVSLYEDIEPSFYALEQGDTKVCLATGFSRHDKLRTDKLFKGTSATFIDRNSTDDTTRGLYSQVKIMSNDDKCEERIDNDLPPESVVNLQSLTVLGLRILFVKSVAFNIVLTLSLIISRERT